MRELVRMATQMGIAVHVAHIDDDPALLGYYSPEHGIIVLRMDLTPFEKKSVLAHEIAHAFYGDACSEGPQERRANRYAAMLLITPESYAAAEAIDPHPAAIADELEVTIKVVESYQEYCLQRLGRRTYGRARAVGLHGDLARQLSS